MKFSQIWATLEDNQDDFVADFLLNTIIKRFPIRGNSCIIIFPDHPIVCKNPTFTASIYSHYSQDKILNIKCFILLIQHLGVLCFCVSVYVSEGLGVDLQDGRCTVSDKNAIVM